ncbi:protein ecdysoneless homolog isoform X1 [Selaginella moellendorffii]|uniref:protein ecdysoneless homolog isoform X1 n=1 Tax=Selaginella moellendorffii TaxID=88036 RepID=UPI000D1CC87D|nr:protein ecdysoneless homolog isoform X1 [Selaginella moellendorffii]|eukprot:XP_024532720.1 protein ecdysoneless homolog isoform X1 [Selaginella moellendorffii]
MDAGAEDAVFYSIYPGLPAGASDGDALIQLQRLRDDCLAVASPLVRGYIWQHAQFDLQVALSAPPSHREPAFSGEEEPAARCDPGLPLVYGRTRYGHNLEDEWFVVYLLYEISRRIPGVYIRVWDSDGEFLLIEAAYAIPRWLKPENSQNRVFISQGSLHILPLPTSPAHVGLSLANPTLAEAVRVLSSGSVDTRASEGVQAAIGRKLEGYPERSRKNMHRVRCKVPLSVAQVLKHEPQLVALAVEAFYTRDHDAMAAASRMEKFLRGGQDEIVTVAVCLSKAMYAQLKQQVFQAPRIYPAEGQDDIGVKLACGFEMMYWERSNFQDEQAVGKTFRKGLEARGYFKDLLEGSKEHRQLLDAAFASYRETETFSRIREAMQVPAKRIDEILALEHKAEDFMNVDIPESDDDSWLYRGEDELTSAMQERQKEMDAHDKKSGAKTLAPVVEGEFDPSELTKTMKSFVDKISSFEGAEVPKNDEPVSMDLENFMQELKTALKLDNERAGDLQSGSSDSDSGEDDDSKGEDDFMEEYSDAIQHELKNSSVSKTFAQPDVSRASGSASTSATATGDDNLHVDVDLNLLKNLLDSYSSQQGLPGPASNVLGMMGMQLPDDKEEHKRKTRRK